MVIGQARLLWARPQSSTCCRTQAHSPQKEEGYEVVLVTQPGHNHDRPEIAHKAYMGAAFTLNMWQRLCAT